ncbi:MAG: hypothetical protein GYA21_18695 [Myxococcales bacterium]|nr:hypothetical protein [Myxococcales bacterium]
MLRWTGLYAMLVCASCASITPQRVRQMGRDGDTASLVRVYAEAETDEMRKLVIEALSLHPADAAAWDLIRREAAGAPDAEVRRTAMRALSGDPAPEATAILIAGLADPFPEVRETARQTLSARGRGAQPLLLAAAQENPNPLVREGALRLGLSAARHSDDLRPEAERLALSLLCDESPRVRAAAIEELGRLASVAAGPLLSELRYSDPDETVRALAERTLARLPRQDETLPLLAVLPFRDSAGAASEDGRRLGEELAEYLRARLAAAGRCRVVDRSRMQDALEELGRTGIPLYDGDAPNAPELGRFRLAQQLVYGSIQRRKSAITLVVSRMDVATLEIVPGSSVTVTGFIEDLEPLKDELARRLLASFR